MKINLSCPLNQLGYGIVGTNLLKELISGGHEVSLWPIPSVEHIQVPENLVSIVQDSISNQSSYDKRAPSIRLWHQFDLAQHIGSGTRIGFPIFELNKFNDRELHHLKAQDKIFVNSKWAKDVLAENVCDNVFVVPCGVDREIFNEYTAYNPKYYNPKITTFINIGKWEIRKGHDVLCEAFNKAFEKHDNVRLLMVCYNPFYTKEENASWANMYKSSKLGDKIQILGENERFPLQSDIASIMKCADCGVFPSRAEGWGLESLEMMSMGKSVILTNYSGHTEYATTWNSLLIPHGNLEDAYDGKWFNGQGEWMELGDDQMDTMINHMKYIHKLKKDNDHGALINFEGIKTALQFSWKKSVEKLVEYSVA